MSRGIVIGNNSGSSMKIGEVTMLDMSADLGNGFLKCDGSTIDSANYPELYNLFPDHKVPQYFVTAYINSGKPKS